VLSSAADILIIATLAALGIAMAPLPIAIIACEFAAAVAFGMVLDVVKIPSLSVCASREFSCERSQDMIALSSAERLRPQSNAESWSQTSLASE